VSAVPARPAIVATAVRHARRLLARHPVIDGTSDAALVAALIATGQPAQLAGHFDRALENGVQPSDASGLLAHLAINCGWPSAVSALDVCEQVYTARTVDTAALRAVRARLPDPVSDAARARAVTD
jgi:4-carboxymuconolactone decarboxylase